MASFSHRSLLLSLQIAFASLAASALAEKPDPFADAVAVWHMDSSADQGAQVAELEPIGGRAHFNLPLEGGEATASLARGLDARVAALRDAAFNLGQGREGQLDLCSDQLSMALRIDNPTDHWDVTLFSKHGGHDRLAYNIYAFSTEGGGAELGVEIGTENGLGRVSTMVAGEHLDGWLDIIARYDGEHVELFVNGQSQGAAPLTGDLRCGDSIPVTLAGEFVDGSVTRRFSGDIDYAALWDRALTDEEIASLSDYVPVPRYAEPYRPQFHFTPETNWTNDPNGLVYHQGRYHLFYQHNPFGTRWGHMSWGHAISPDLAHWEHRPVALEEEDGVMIFSGSAVHDRHNTSGFAEDDAEDGPLVLIYTGHHIDGTRQTQDLAYSTDAGESWTKYEGNPVIDISKAHFRDPKVFWYEPDERWIMVVALADERKVSIYGSPNLRDWEHLSNFGPAGAVGVPNWECPDLFELPVQGSNGETRWVLQVDVGGNAPAGGSGGQYFIGHFDGRAFRNENPDDEVRWADYGADFYAVQSWSGIPEADGRSIWIAWMNNWQYANDIPTSPWRGAMTIPREVGLRLHEGEIRLTQQPVRELEKLRGEPIELENVTVAAGKNPLYQYEIAGKALDIVAVFELDTAKRFGLNVRESKGEVTRVGYDAAESAVFVDRTASGQSAFNAGFAAIHAAPLKVEEDRITLRILVDHSSVEVFADDGLVSITDRIFPDGESDGLSVFAEGGEVHLRSLTVYPMESVWSPRPALEGAVPEEAVSATGTAK